MNKIRNFFAVFLMLIASATFSQSMTMVHGIAPELYLEHSVAPKETWYSLGRMYNLTPKEIAAFNKMNLNSTLSISQVIRIPLTKANFVQDDKKSPNEVLVPLYHTVKEKEWMYRISVNHNKVPIETLEKWNNISRDNAVAGTNLIVGFLKLKEGQAPQGQAGGAIADKSPATTTTRQDPPKVNNSPQPIPKETPKTVAATEPAVKSTPPVKTTTPPASRNTSGNRGGYFGSQFEPGNKKASGISGIFKSTSGWTDGKYYALMNNVNVGTIIKVSTTGSDKFVYAKVLGSLPDMKESDGLTLRLSDAAASEIGAGGQKFEVNIVY